MCSLGKAPPMQNSEKREFAFNAPKEIDVEILFNESVCTSQKLFLSDLRGIVVLWRAFQDH